MFVCKCYFSWMKHEMPNQCGFRIPLSLNLFFLYCWWIHKNPFKVASLFIVFQRQSPTAPRCRWIVFCISSWNCMLFSFKYFFQEENNRHIFLPNNNSYMSLLKSRRFDVCIKNCDIFLLQDRFISSISLNISAKYDNLHTSIRYLKPFASKCV